MYDKSPEEKIMVFLNSWILGNCDIVCFCLYFFPSVYSIFIIKDNNKAVCILEESEECKDNT